MLWGHQVSVSDLHEQERTSLDSLEDVYATVVDDSGRWLSNQIYRMENGTILIDLGEIDITKNGVN
ncbi:hypothetical protein GCM10023331_28380 [Algivirga pacifica]|uniref:Uncharacterized protein n=1 Tax=Algivirga pacifica TaxID=1162670 RepID=A0ABP9DEY3_9BACT